jgi:hypothetical protein
MKPDLYTKVVLTVIALMLTVIACKTVISPGTTANAQGPFAGVQYAGRGEFFDSRTGEIWIYGSFGGVGDPNALEAKLRLTKLGQPRIVEFNAYDKK